MGALLLHESGEKVREDVPIFCTQSASGSGGALASSIVDESAPENLFSGERNDLLNALRHDAEQTAYIGDAHSRPCLAPSSAADWTVATLA